MSEITIGSADILERLQAAADGRSADVISLCAEAKQVIEKLLEALQIERIATNTLSVEIQQRAHDVMPGEYVLVHGQDVAQLVRRHDDDTANLRIGRWIGRLSRSHFVKHDGAVWLT